MFLKSNENGVKWNQLKSDFLQYSYVSTTVISRKYWSNLRKSTEVIYIVTTLKLHTLDAYF